MKKLFTILAAIMVAGSMWATDVTFTFKTDNDITYTATGTSGGGDACEVSKGGVTLQGTNAYTESTKSLSCYAPSKSIPSSTLTITAAGNISQVDLVYNGQVYPFDEALGDDEKASGGKFNAKGNHSATYTPSSPTQEVVFTNSNGGKVELLSITVTYTSAGNIAATGVSLNKTATTIYAGQNETLTASVAPVNATNKNVTWASSDEDVVTVANGVVTAVAAGTAIITVTTTDGSFQATCEVTVLDFVHVTGLSLDQEAATIKVKKFEKLTATLTPAEPTNANIIWASDNETVATVANGVVRALAVGTANITATSEDCGIVATCAVTVVANVAPAGAVFFESFDQLAGAGGNDNVWSGTIANTAFANSDQTWTTEGTVYSASACVSLRKYSEKVDGKDVYYPSGITTPALGLSGFAQVQFDVESWGTDGSNFFVDIVGNGTFVASNDLAVNNISNEGKTAKVFMLKSGTWKTFTLELKGTDASTQLRFYVPANKRAFLDEVVVFNHNEAVYNPCSTTLQAQNEAGYWATCSRNDACLFFPNTVTAYTVGVNGNAIELTAIAKQTINIDGDDVEGSLIPENTGALLFSEAAEVDHWSIYYYDAAALANNLLVAGNGTKPSNTNYTYYKLAYGDEERTPSTLGFYYGAADGAAFTVNEGYAYLRVPKAATVADRFLLTPEQPVATAIENAVIANGMKRMINGQLFVIREGAMFNINGMLVK